MGCLISAAATTSLATLALLMAGTGSASGSKMGRKIRLAPMGNDLFSRRLKEAAYTAILDAGSESNYPRTVEVCVDDPIGRNSLRDSCLEAFPHYSDHAVMASAYLRLMSEEGWKKMGSVTVVPVLPSTEFAMAFVRELSKASVEGIQLREPVIYKRDDKPSGIIDEIASRVDEFEGAAVFLASSDRLPQLAKAASYNNRLLRMRWFARDALRHEDWLHANDAGEDFAIKVSLMTLATLPMGEEVQHLAVEKGKIVPNFGSFFDQVSVYEAIARIKLGKEKTGASSPSFVSLMFLPSGRNLPSFAIEVLPGMGWIILGTLSGKEGYKKVGTLRFVKSELQDAFNTKEVRQIAVRTDMTRLHPSMTAFYRVRDELPDVLSVPASGKISISVSFKNESLDFTYACVPSSVDESALDCWYQRPRRVRRASTRDIMIGLIPNFMTCAAAVAGCDFCIYFTSTYNITLRPSGCVGGCSAGTVSTCTGLIGSVISKVVLA